jgi:2-iminobutanoate/2-iminopropanoate deaminase
MIDIISTEKAPQAIGPYNQATVHGHTLYVSGQIAIDPETNSWEGGDIEAQTHRVLKNLRAVLEAGGASLETVLHCTIFVRDMADYPKINDIYASYFAAERAPARALVEVSGLPKDARIEMTAIAAV